MGADLGQFWLIRVVLGSDLGWTTQRPPFHVVCGRDERVWWCQQVCYGGLAWNITQKPKPSSLEVHIMTHQQQRLQRLFSPLIPLHKRWTSRSETRRLATASAPGAPDPEDTLVARSGWMFYPTTCVVYKPCNIRWTLSDVYDTLFSNISSRTILSNHRHTCPARRSWEAPGGVHPFTIPHSLKRGCLPRPV